MACKSGHEMRAVELCKLIRSEQTLNLALKYTMLAGNSSLAEKITTIIEDETNAENDSTEPLILPYSKTSYNMPSTSYK